MSIGEGVLSTSSDSQTSDLIVSIVQVSRTIASSSLLELYMRGWYLNHEATTRSYSLTIT